MRIILTTRALARGIDRIDLGKLPGYRPPKENGLPEKQPVSKLPSTAQSYPPEERFFKRSMFWRLNWFATQKPTPAIQITNKICQVFISFSRFDGCDKIFSDSPRRSTNRRLIV
jgi:hypothetical protein